MKNLTRIISVLFLGLAFGKADAQNQADTFNYTGSVQTWTVPCGATSLTVTLYGATGGAGGDETYGNVNPGGVGGIVVGTYSTTPGTVLNIYVGGAGQNQQDFSYGLGGWNGGGNGGYDGGTWIGGGGGGASDIRVGGVALANRIAVAGAGGGGGDNTNSYNLERGGPGGSTSAANGAGFFGGTQDAATSYCGQGATVATYGAGGTSCVGTVASLGVGGNACTYTSGGGGGAGYYGGGCGCYGGAGGGSSYTGGLTSVTTNTIGTAPTLNGMIIITLPANAFTTHMGTITNPMCVGGTGTATVNSSGGTPPYTYSWSPNGGSNATGTGLTAGSYTVTVYDNTGCSETASATLTQPNPIIFSAFTTQSIACNGGNTGAAGSSISGGSMPYTYLWSPAGGTNSTANGLTSGTYNITVTDLCGTTASSSTYISQPNPIGVGAFVTANETCNGGNNGSATAFAYSGTPAYSYAWAPAGGTNASATGLTAGSYTVTATDSCGQSSTIQVSITEPNPVVVTLNATANEICRGAFEGSASSNISGGTLPFTYSWTGGAGSTDTASGLAAGTYTLSVVDMNGCTGSSSVAITQPNMLGAIAGVTGDVSCNGGSNGSASVSASGGTAAYTYSWFPSGGNNPSASGLSAGTYTVTIDDACNGSASATVVITQTSAIIVSTATTGNALCNGGTDGSANSSVSGGTAPYTYLWTGGSTNSIASGLSAGTYTLTVEDGDGCTATSSTVIMQPTALSIVKDSVPDDGHCHGSAWVTVSGGVGPYNYDWSNGNTTYLDNNICKGSYCCTVTDANGCKDSVCVKITSTLGVDGIASNEGEINIYPNPNNGQFTIQSSVSGKSLVEIYNVLGEKVYGSSLSSTSGASTINMGNQPNGVYLYRILSESGNLIAEGKITIQK